MYSRREFGRLALAGAALPFLPAFATSEVAGVHLGVQTYSYRQLPRPPDGDVIGQVIAAMKEDGLDECELFAPQVEPRAPGGSTGRRGAAPTPEQQKAREDLRRFRLDTPLDHFREVGRRFKGAGITVYAYNYSFNTSFSDAEIDRGFEMAKALGAEIVTASTTLDVARRVVPFAEKHRMIVAMHGHSKVDDPNELATPESFAAAMAMSKLFKVNLDIGHFTAGNYDPVAYIREHHADITNIHLKDRRKNQGDNMPWGEGDTPIRQVLQLIGQQRWPIRAYIEYEYKGTGSPIEEVKKCADYVRQALATS